MGDDALLVGRDLRRPGRCEKCGGELEYKGVGEYCCTDCKAVCYDDYGLVRNYVEKNRGATLGEVAKATGVSKNTIRQLLRDDRIEVTPNSAVFLSCEMCGAPIRSGRLCQECQSKRRISDSAGSSPNKSIQGFGKVTQGSSGARRFER